LRRRWRLREGASRPAIAGDAEVGMGDKARASDAEALRLAQAFFRIRDRRLRRHIIDLVEACADEASPRPHLVSLCDETVQDNVAETDRLKH
jgi:hypothetical protein